MKALFLLIVLTQNGAGDINVSFVNTGTLQQCQQKALMLEGVFTGAGIPVIENRCIKSELQFSRFEHASASSKISNFYRLYFEGDSVQVSKMPDWQSCMQQKMNWTEQHGAKPGRLYCGSSVQSFK